MLGKKRFNHAMFFLSTKCDRLKKVIYEDTKNAWLSKLRLRNLFRPHTQFKRGRNSRNPSFLRLRGVSARENEREHFAGFVDSQSHLEPTPKICGRRLKGWWRKHRMEGSTSIVQQLVQEDTRAQFP